MFDKILICSDGSESALLAARAGARIAQQFHSAVVLVHSYDPAAVAYPAFGGGGWEFAAGQDVLDVEAEDARRDMIQHTGKIFEEAGVKYETLLECGHPVEAITRVAIQHKADLIVLGGRGLSDRAALLMGSVSEGVLHRAHCPVLIVRGDCAAQQAPEWREILLASDGSEGAGQAAVFAIGIAQKFAASLRVLNVLDGSSLPYSLSPFRAADSETPQSRSERLLATITAEVSKEACAAGVPRTFHQETGDPADIICGFTDCLNLGLIVVGCRGRGTLTSLLLGSVSNSVAHRSRRSVLVTR